jgi:hypothetical protein
MDVTEMRVQNWIKPFSQAGCCEPDNKSSGSINNVKLLDQLNLCKLLKDDDVTWGELMGK